MTTATSGRTSLRPFGFYDPDTSSLRTSQGTFPWDSTESSLTLPPSGSMRSGELSERATLAPATSAPVCSSLLPTPRTSDTNGAGSHGDGGLDLRTTVALLPTPTAWEQGETVESWERRRAVQKNLHRNGNGFGVPLDMAVKMLPTPTVGDSKAARNSTATRHRTPPTGIHAGDTLTDAVSLLPTPTARDHKGQNQRRDTTCLPGAITALPLSDTPPQSDGPLRAPPTSEDALLPDSWSG